MAFPIQPPVEPMLAALRSDIPEGEGWLYEPKWDGFRALIFRDGDRVHIASRNQLPLERYFPEVVDLARASLADRCVVDGEIVIAGEAGLDFDALQLRLHPAASRVRTLAAETPGSFVAFDLLADERDRREEPFVARRALLERVVSARRDFFCTPQTDDPAEARAWFERFEGAGLDGVIAKRADLPYVEDERVMVKVKHERTADCVVAGYRLDKTGSALGSLLLGLYDDAGLLHHVGFTSTFRAPERRAILELLQPLRGGEGFTGRAPGGPSRWKRQEAEWFPLHPRLVCEVAFDHLQGDRFRHGTRFLRWRKDKDPGDCTYAQFEPPQPFRLEDIYRLAHEATGRG